MNERIRELALKAGFEEHLFAGGGMPLDILNFYELIVKECLDECWYDCTPKQISDNIKRKFGVTE